MEFGDSTLAFNWIRIFFMFWCVVFNIWHINHFGFPLNPRIGNRSCLNWNFNATETVSCSESQTYLPFLPFSKWIFRRNISLCVRHDSVIWRNRNLLHSFVDLNIFIRFVDCSAKKKQNGHGYRRCRLMLSTHFASNWLLFFYRNPLESNSCDNWSGVRVNISIGIQSFFANEYSRHLAVKNKWTEDTVTASIAYNRRININIRTKIGKLNVSERKMLELFKIFTVNRATKWPNHSRHANKRKEKIARVFFSHTFPQVIKTKTIFHSV